MDPRISDVAVERDVEETRTFYAGNIMAGEPDRKSNARVVSTEVSHDEDRVYLDAGEAC